MRAGILLLLIYSSMRADNVPPTIVISQTSTGSGFAQVSGSLNSVGDGFEALISGSTKTVFPGDFASVDVTVEGEFEAIGTGLGILNYAGSGESDGSNGGGQVRYQINDITGACTVSCFGGLEPFGESEQIQLGTPFFLMLSSGATSFSAQYPEGESFDGNISFNVTTLNGTPVELTEIALLTPEPGSAWQILIGLFAVAFAQGARSFRPRKRRLRKPRSRFF